MLLDARTFAAKLWPIRFLNRPDFCCVGLNIVYFAKGEPRNVEYCKFFLWKCNIWVIRTRKLPDANFLFIYGTPAEYGLTTRRQDGGVSAIMLKTIMSV